MSQKPNSVGEYAAILAERDMQPLRRYFNRLREDARKEAQRSRPIGEEPPMPRNKARS